MNIEEIKQILKSNLSKDEIRLEVIKSLANDSNLVLDIVDIFKNEITPNSKIEIYEIFTDKQFKDDLSIEAQLLVDKISDLRNKNNKLVIELEINARQRKIFEKVLYGKYKTRLKWKQK